MTKVLGYSIIEHHEDGTTVTINKVSAEKMMALVSEMGASRGGGSKYTYLNADECPVHGPWKAIQAGVSKSTGKEYDAFWTCDTDQGEPRCTNKPSKDWVETHPPHMAGNSVAKPEPASDPGEFDDLPF